MPPPGSELVDWITDWTRKDRTIVSAIPPMYAAYATIVVPDGDEAKTQSDRALVEALEAHAPADRWWLGYLDTGAADLSNIKGQRVSAYAGWTYVLKACGPRQVLAARDNGHSTPGTAPCPSFCSRTTAHGSSRRCGTTTGAASADPRRSSKRCWRTATVRRSP